MKDPKTKSDTTSTRKSPPKTPDTDTASKGLFSDFMDRYGNRAIQAAFGSQDTATQSYADGDALQIPPAFTFRPNPASRVDAVRSSILQKAADDMSDAELARQIENLNKALQTEPPNSLEAEQLRQNRRMLEDAQVVRLLNNTPDAKFNERGPSSLPLQAKWIVCASDFGETYKTLVMKTSRFKSAVLSSAYIRLTHNRENLEIWRKFINTQFTAVELQKQAYAQTATDLMHTAQIKGTMQVMPQWASDPNPYSRNVEEDWIHGKNQLCTGCHLMVQAHDTESWMYDTFGKQVGRGGPAWQSPASRLSAMADFMIPEGAEWKGGEKSLMVVRAAIQKIGPTIEQLGEYGYRIIPSDTMSLFANADALTLKAKINDNIDDRRSDYLRLQGMIASGRVKYLDLTPVLADMMAMGAPDVVRAIQAEIDEGPSLLEGVLKALVELLLMILVPPLGLVIAGAQALAGMDAFMQGYAALLSTGANDVTTREHQDMAGSLMAGGVIQVGMATAAFVTMSPIAADWTATRVITMADAKFARELGARALRGPITEAELLQLDKPGLLTRTAQRWTDWRGYQILYRGQPMPGGILSPLARESMGLSTEMYNMLKAQGLSDAEIAGFTGRFAGDPVPGFASPPNVAGMQRLGGSGIPTTSRLNIAARYAQGEQGIIYVLRVPKSLPVRPGFAAGSATEAEAGLIMNPKTWQARWSLESENIVFHQIPDGYVVGDFPGSSFTPLSVKTPPGGVPTLKIKSSMRPE